jgi:hypothetical protein
VFATRLRELYQAAGNPDLATLVRQGKGQKPPLDLKDATLSDWLTGVSVPSKVNEPGLEFLVEFLEGRAVRRDARHPVLGAARWLRQCEAARRARRSSGAARPPGGRRGTGVVARSAYLEQVRQLIAPPELIGRDAELAELAAFCNDPDRGCCLWWQAEAWAGKTALLSTFVARPPEQFSDRVWLVAFFITARLAGQDTRAAFTEVVTQQVCRLLGQNLPTGLTEATRDAALLDLFAQAAENRQHAGGRLILLVDGLDEDRGVTTGPHARSIAGLLPGTPPTGMRVIVAGRPNPPIPDDVPDWHPLRDPGIIRPLSASPHAADLRRLSHAELKRLLIGSATKQDLLGLLTAAGGGLSGDDLRQLTDTSLVEIEELLHTVTGRTFIRGVGRWTRERSPQVYLLGHEELQAAAVHYIGEDRLTGYRDRIHTWADTYRNPYQGRPAWPADTPEYLLTGYPRMLATSGETDRLVALAIDPARHDRMLDLSGGDAAALTEITTTQDLILAGPEPDLEAMLRLCIRRTNLAGRNRHTPANLPAVWAALGQPARAEALARSITYPHTQAKALAAVAGAIATAGDPDRARQLADRAETVARSITNPHWQAQVLTAVAAAIATAGDPEQAGRLLGTVLVLVSWQMPLSVLARHWPQVVVRCVDALSGNDRSRDTRPPPDGNPHPRSSPPR